MTVQPAAPPNRQEEKTAVVSRVVDAVERILATRAATAPPDRPAPASQVRAAAVSNVAGVVDRFLAARAATAPTDRPAPASQPVQSAAVPSVADVVNRFLGVRSVTAPADKPAPAAAVPECDGRRGSISRCTRCNGTAGYARAGPFGGQGCRNSQRGRRGGGSIPARPILRTGEWVLLTDQSEPVRVPHCVAGTPAGAGRRAASTGPAGSRAGRVRVRSRRARRHPAKPQDLHRAEDDRHALRPRPGQAL